MSPAANGKSQISNVQFEIELIPLIRYLKFEI